MRFGSPLHPLALARGIQRKHGPRPIFRTDPRIASFNPPRPTGGRNSEGRRGSHLAIRWYEHGISCPASSPYFGKRKSPSMSEAHALLLPLHPLALARGMSGSMGLARSSRTDPRIASFNPPRPTAGRNSEGAEGEPASRSACHRIEHRRSHLIGRSSTRTSPRPHQTVTARWRHLGRRRAQNPEKAPLPPKKYRFTGIVGAVEVLKL